MSSIVVFDEAHNIDNICIEALSVTLNKRTLQMGTRVGVFSKFLRFSLGPSPSFYWCYLQNVSTLKHKVVQMERSNRERLEAEYQQLLQGMSAGSNASDVADDISSHSVLSRENLSGVLPSNFDSFRTSSTLYGCAQRPSLMRSFQGTSARLDTLSTSSRLW